MPDTAQPPSSGRWLLPGAAALLIATGAFLTWRHLHQPAAGDPAKDATSSSPVAHQPPATPSGKPAATSTGTRPPKVDATPDEAAENQINQWLSDDKISTDEAARRLWNLAADTSHSQDVRMDALVNSLNLADDAQFRKEFAPTLNAISVWNGDLGDYLLDNLANRDERSRAAGLGPLLEHAQGDFRDHVREILSAALDAEDADDGTLIRKAAELAAQPDPPEESEGQ